MIAEADILEALSLQRLALPPLTFRVLERDRTFERNGRKGLIDAVVEARWGDRVWLFAAEAKRLATPKVLQEALSSIKASAEQERLRPLIVVPYLSSTNIAMLEALEVSGVDLCGNGIVTVPGELLVSRTGNPNRFPRSEPIRNVYRGDSSLVGRALLARPTSRKVGDVLASVLDLGGKVTLPTVSKVLKALEDELIVGRANGAIALLQPDKLLDLLSANFRLPVEKERYVGRVNLGERELQTALADTARRIGARFALTGAASATKYAVMAREPVVTAYCDRPPEELLAALTQQAERTTRFPNLDLRWTRDASAYFDLLTDADVPYASPVQAYLELMSGDKRQQETAEQVRAYVLRRARADRVAV